MVMAKPPARPFKPAGGGKPSPKGKAPAGKFGKPARPAGVSKPTGGAPGKKHGFTKHAAGHGKGKPPAQAPAVPLSRKDQKVAKRNRFAAIKKNFNIIQDAAQLWEVMRPKNTPNEERKEMVDQVIGKVHGKVLELAQNHTASRIIQFCIKYGSAEQKAAIMAEVRASIVELAKSKHGHYLVQKLVTAAKKEDITGIVAQFKGHVAELLRHPRGADVLVDLFDVASTEQRNAMCAEFYGMEFVLFDGVATRSGGLSGLKQLLEGVNVAKRRAIFQHMTRALAPIMEKAILHPPMVHRLIREFLECAPAMSVEDAVDTLTQAGTNVLKMVHTHDGAAAVCMLIAYGSMKDRKRMIKSMKGHVHDMATNEWAHAALCTLFNVADDTSAVNKALIPELKAMVAEAVDDQYAHRVLLQLLSPDNRRYLPQAVLEMMHPAQRTVVGGSGKMVTDLEGDEDEVDVHAGFGGDDAGNGDDDELFAQPSSSKKQKQDKGKKQGKKGKQAGNGDDEEAGGKASAAGDSGDEDGEDAQASTGPRVLGLSKKTSEQRRAELLGQGANSLGGVLAAVVADQAGALLRSPHGCDVVVEVARGGDAGLLSQQCPDGVAQVQQALVALVGRPKDEYEGQGAGPRGQGEEDGEDGMGPQMEHVMVHYYASRALRRLVLSSVDEEGRGSPAAVSCVELLWDSALKGRCRDWVGTHGDKVLGSLLHCGSERVKEEAAKELRPLLQGQDLQQWSEPLVKPHAKEKGGKGKAQQQGQGKQQQGQGKQQGQGQGAKGKQQVKAAEQQQQQQQGKQQKQGKQQQAGSKAQAAKQQPPQAKKQQAAAAPVAGTKRPAAAMQAAKPAKKQAAANGKGKN